jgi:cell division protein FtsL
MNLFFDIYKTYSYGMFICLGLLMCVMILMQVVITSAHKTRKRFEAERPEVSAAEGAQN